MELTAEERTAAKRRIGKVVKLIGAGVHMKSKSTAQQLSEPEQHAFEYTYRSQLPAHPDQLSLQRLRDFKVCPSVSSPSAKSVR